MTAKRLGVLLLLSITVVSSWTDCSQAAPGLTLWEPLDRIEAAARKEGQLVIYSAPGHTGPEVQQAIGEHFRRKYGVAIGWTSLSSRDAELRVLAEQRTRQYAVDLTMSGFGGASLTFRQKGYSLPIMAPSTLDKAAFWIDPAIVTTTERDWLFISLPLNPAFIFNTRLVPPNKEPQSYRDLLDPRWKGKIVLQTPAVGGSGSGWFRATYSTLSLDYMRALAPQVAIVSGANEVPDTVARGQYAIGIAPTRARARQLIAEGAPVKFGFAKEGANLQTNGIILIANAPHPNAAKLFLHWFYTAEGQALYAKKHMQISLRKDISQDHLPPAERYYEGQKVLIGEPNDFTPERAKELYDSGRQIFVEKR